MQKLEQKSTSLGLELGSTRIKAVLAGPDGTVLASGAHDWQNRFEGGYWTYHLDEVWTGVQHAFRDLARNYEAAFGEPLRTVGALGVSAMMHGYLPFDRQGRPLTAFRTWRNTTTRAAAEALTERFRFNIPQRWTVAHFYQAILNGEDHVRQVDFLTTLAGYLHWQLTGQKSWASGMRRASFRLTAVPATTMPGCWPPLTSCWPGRGCTAICGTCCPGYSAPVRTPAP